MTGTHRLVICLVLAMVVFAVVAGAYAYILAVLRPMLFAGRLSRDAYQSTLSALQMIIVASAIVAVSSMIRVWGRGQWIADIRAILFTGLVGSGIVMASAILDVVRPMTYSRVIAVSQCASFALVGLALGYTGIRNTRLGVAGRAFLLGMSGVCLLVAGWALWASDGAGWRNAPPPRTKHASTSLAVCASRQAATELPAFLRRVKGQ